MSKRLPRVEAISDGKFYNLYLTHACRSGVIVQSLPGVIWAIKKLKPLTVEQQIHCGFCGLVGWWREGAWVADDRPTVARQHT